MRNKRADIENIDEDDIEIANNIIPSNDTISNRRREEKLSLI